MFALAALSSWMSCGRDNGPEFCNGARELCARRFDEVAHPTTHNAMSNADDGWVAPNQEHGIARQLADGVRALMLDTHLFRDEPYLCHSRCEFGRKSLEEGLSEIGDFMEGHPDEVLSIIFESNVTAAQTETAFVASGLIRYVHAQPADDAWPTLEEMIVSGERMVVFTDSEGGSPVWYHDVWKYAWETHFHFETVEELSCAINRGDARHSLFIFNHFLTSPVALPSLAEQINYDPLLGERARQCWTESGRIPNFVTVDFYSIGDLFTVVDGINGVGSAMDRRGRKDRISHCGLVPEPPSTTTKGRTILRVGAAEKDTQ